MNKDDSVIFPCDKVKYKPVDKYDCESQGTCLVIPVTLHCVCIDSYILVIVEVIKDGRLYARKIKKIFTGNSFCNDMCYCKENRIIEKLFVGDFKFYFIGDCTPKCIRVEVSTQYIYDC